MPVQFKGPNDSIIRLPERFELKYFLAPRDVGSAYGLLRHTCPPAPDYASEQINSLYFDTAELEQYERSDDGDYQKDKVRIRWYGRDEELRGIQAIYLELKSRRGFASTKQRSFLQVPAKYLTRGRLGQGVISRNTLSDTLASFGYFPTGILQPVIKISYWRYRFSDIISSQRVSLDCRIRSTMIMPGPGNGEKELELPCGIIEIKGRSMDLPITLRGLRLLNIDWSRFSKYSACIDSHTEIPGTVGWLSPPGRVVQL
jgi:hypothetical protein